MSGSLCLLFSSLKTRSQFGKSVGRILTDRGYLVVAASDGAIALQLVELSSPDLIILDIYLPVLDGRRFVQLYRQRPEPHAAILVITGCGHAAERAAALDVAGALDKPFRPRELLTKVEALIGLPASETQVARDGASGGRQSSFSSARPSRSARRVPVG